jgi:hypothetical protein
VVYAVEYVRWELLLGRLVWSMCTTEAHAMVGASWAGCYRWAAVVVYAASIMFGCGVMCRRQSLLGRLAWSMCTMEAHAMSGASWAGCYRWAAENLRLCCMLLSS